MFDGDKLSESLEKLIEDKKTYLYTVTVITVMAV